MQSFTPNIRKAQLERNSQIRKLYASGKYTYQDLANQYRISRQRIAQIMVAKVMY